MIGRAIIKGWNAECFFLIHQVYKKYTGKPYWQIFCNANNFVRECSFLQVQCQQVYSIYFSICLLIRYGEQVCMYNVVLAPYIQQRNRCENTFIRYYIYEYLNFNILWKGTRKETFIRENILFF